MLTRCVHQVHVFVDSQTQCTGPYHDLHAVGALADRWTRDASKLSASVHLDPAGHCSSDQAFIPTRLRNLEPDAVQGVNQSLLSHAQATPPGPSARQPLNDPLAHELGISNAD